jgi:thiamine-monophosphate kinase
LSLGEFELIDRLLRPLAAGFPGALALRDDAALVDVPPERQLVIAKDALVAGVHFLPEDPADLVAGKLLRVNLSDLAAMGAEPLAYLTVIGRPPQLSEAWLQEFVRGLERNQAMFGLHLIGGDTVSTTGPAFFSLTILGLVNRSTALRRDGARPGDLVCVSGTLGDAAMGLRILRGLAAPEDLAMPLVERYRTPQPRVELGKALRGVATAAIDISDGLLADLVHVLEASGVGARIEASALPLSTATRALPGARSCALCGGDDYELLFTVPVERAPVLSSLSRKLQLPLTVIGRTRVEPGLEVVDERGQPVTLERLGWRHF